MSNALELISDGGCTKDGIATCACIIRAPHERRKLKLLAYLGDADNTEAELAGGLLGFSFLHLQTPSSVLWVCDHKATLDGAQTYAAQWQRNNWRNASNESISHRGMWQMFLKFSADWQVTVRHVLGHSGHRDQEACDRACRWGLEKGIFLLGKYGEGPQGTLAARSPELAWHLIDARGFLDGLRRAEPAESAFAFFLERLRDQCLTVFPGATLPESTGELSDDS